MLVWDPPTRAEELRRAELDVLVAAQVVTGSRRVAALTVEELDALDVAVEALTRTFREQLWQVPPGTPGDAPTGHGAMGEGAPGGHG